MTLACNRWRHHLFILQPTLNRFCNYCIKSYWYWVSSSWNMKGKIGVGVRLTFSQKILDFKSAVLLGLNIKQIFWKMKIFFNKMEYSFLVERTKILNVTIPYKTALPEANVEKNRMETTKWSYHKKRSFTSCYFIFLKSLF